MACAQRHDIPPALRPPHQPPRARSTHRPQRPGSRSAHPVAARTPVWSNGGRCTPIRFPVYSSPFLVSCHLLGTPPAKLSPAVVPRTQIRTASPARHRSSRDRAAQARRLAARQPRPTGGHRRPGGTPSAPRTPSPYVPPVQRAFLRAGLTVIRSILVKAQEAVCPTSGRRPPLHGRPLTCSARGSATACSAKR